MSTTTSTDLTGSYTIDLTRSRIGFIVRQAMVTKVRGSFNEYTGIWLLRRRGSEPVASRALDPGAEHRRAQRPA